MLSDASALRPSEHPQQRPLSTRGSRSDSETLQLRRKVLGLPALRSASSLWQMSRGEVIEIELPRRRQ
jgi:hypothetical protein